ncbi:MAG: fibronectin type III domain-containing protein [Dysgonamonadaceae bacterium]|jgi:hypothetical protein|nr:fibronectin type III domain-containing protein [Dysgonamonadaceae bacterium]
MKNIFSKLMILSGLLAGLFTASCDDPAALPGDQEYDRLFSPTGVNAVITNYVHASISWKNIEGATAYVVEIYKGENETEAAGLQLQQEVAGNKIEFDGESDTKYTVRVKAVGEKADSKWYSNTFTTQIPDIFLRYEIGDIGVDFAVFRWDPAIAGIEKMVLTPTEGESIERLLEASELQAGEARVEGLSAGMSYSAFLHTVERRISRRDVATYSEGTILVNDGDDLRQLIEGAADGAIILCAPGEYLSGAPTIKLDKSLTIMGYGAEYRPLLHVQFQLMTTAASLTLKDLEMEGVDNTIAYMLSVPDAATELGTIEKITIEGCYMHNYNRSIFGNTKVAMHIKEFIVNDCLVYHFGNGGNDFFDFRTGACNNLTITNSTFFDAPTNRDFFRQDAVAGQTSKAAIDHCTFYASANAATRGILYGNADVELTFTNNIVANTLGNLTSKAAPQPTCGGNNYFGADGFLTAADPDKNKVDNSSDKTVLDPGFADAESGDFHISNANLKGTTGDPRWW